MSEKIKVFVWWIDGMNEYCGRTVTRRLRDLKGKKVIVYGTRILPVDFRCGTQDPTACLDDAMGETSPGRRG